MHPYVDEYIYHIIYIYMRTYIYSRIEKARERGIERERERMSENDEEEKDVELMVIIHHTDFEKCGRFAWVEQKLNLEVKGEMILKNDVVNEKIGEMMSLSFKGGQILIEQTFEGGGPTPHLYFIFYIY